MDLGIDIERTRKAIDDVTERWQQQRPAAVADLMPLLAASRVLCELLANGERVEPDWEAAYAERDHQIGPELDDVAVQKIVKAAIEWPLCDRPRNRDHGDRSVYPKEAENG